MGIIEIVKQKEVCNMTFAAYIQLQKRRITGEGCEVAASAVATNGAQSVKSSVDAVICPRERIFALYGTERCAAARTQAKDMPKADSEQLLREINALVGLNTAERAFYASAHAKRGGYTCRSAV